MELECAKCGKTNRVPTTRAFDNPHCGACKADLTLKTPIAIATELEFDTLVKSSPHPVIVDFWAAWCGPCRRVAPELEILADARAGHAVVLKVDTEALPGLAARFRVQSIPTLVRIDCGLETKRVSGAMSASQIESALLR